MMLFKRIKKRSKDEKRGFLKKRLRKRTKHFLLDKYLSKAGFTIESYLLSRGLFKICLAVNFIISMYVMLFFVTEGGYPFTYILFILVILWALAFFLILAVVWLIFYFILDFKVFRRKLDIEDVLADFLFLTSTNIRSGMTIDRALWFAIRPRFGVLAKEIETVAKEVMSGSELTESLEKFSNKYHSDMLRRSINLLNEGIRSGGEIGGLLTKIASNIQESKLIKKEMASNITAYVIFITFAAIIAAPVLLALSNQLIIIIGSIVSKIEMPATGNVVFGITNVSVDPRDFRIFAYLSITITSFFSSIIVATIKKGTIKEGIGYIPLFIWCGIGVFLITSKILEVIMGGIIM